VLPSGAHPGEDAQHIGIAEAEQAQAVVAAKE
jgi:hypothetical protein